MGTRFRVKKKSEFVDYIRYVTQIQSFKQDGGCWPGAATDVVAVVKLGAEDKTDLSVDSGAYGLVGITLVVATTDVVAAFTDFLDLTIIYLDF